MNIVMPEPDDNFKAIVEMLKELSRFRQALIHIRNGCYPGRILRLQCAYGRKKAIDKFADRVFHLADVALGGKGIPDADDQTEGRPHA